MNTTNETKISAEVKKSKKIKLNIFKNFVSDLKAIKKALKLEIKEIKWVPSKDIARQTIFSFGVITMSMAVFMAFDTGVQMLISYIIK